MKTFTKDLVITKINLTKKNHGYRTNKSRVDRFGIFKYLLFYNYYLDNSYLKVEQLFSPVLLVNNNTLIQANIRYNFKYK